MELHCTAAFAARHAFTRVRRMKDQSCVGPHHQLTLLPTRDSIAHEDKPISSAESLANLLNIDLAEPSGLSLNKLLFLELGDVCWVSAHSLHIPLEFHRILCTMAGDPGGKQSHRVWRR